MISDIRTGTVQAVGAMRASESRANSTLEIAQYDVAILAANLLLAMAMS
ncbi:MULTISPECIES: hypothetical protein [Pseudomonas]|nr:MULTISPECIES: hypothetical protein [Pseudomonas]MCL8304821.1 hypothetical protein [Pseudomonas putida]